MLVSDITFLIIVGVWIVVFTLFTFLWKGNWIFPIVAALGWFLWGFFCFARLEAELFYYQQYIGYLFIAVGIAMLFAPFYTRSKSADVEQNAPDDIDMFKEGRKAHRDAVDKRKQVRRRGDSE